MVLHAALLMCGLQHGERKGAPAAGFQPAMTVSVILPTYVSSIVDQRQQYLGCYFIALSGSTGDLARIVGARAP